MQRVTITFDEDLLADLDRLMARRGYENRSEALRDLTRAAIQEAATEDEAVGDCAAVLVYVYDDSKRELRKRLNHVYRNHHDLSVVKTQANLDEETRMDMTMLRGDSSRIRDFAQRVMTERGVRHGQLMSVALSGLAPAQKAASD